MMMRVTVNVQNQGDGENIQPKINNNNNEIGTRLRRILSNIFHRENREIGFLVKPLGTAGTKGKVQMAICQSPLIQRCLRFISVRYLAGYSSYNCTSEIRPERL